MKVAFLDRDGTICRDYPDQDWANVKHLEIIEQHLQIWQRLIEQGYQLIIVSNQYLIGEAIISRQQFETLHQELLQKLATMGIPILDTFVCPHHRDDICDCHKPGTGLVEQAQAKYDIDMSEALLIGDSINDYQLAERMNIRFLSVAPEVEHRI
ncbi:HAD-IIIA family hydrolase [Culicoidibacter larvae]|nr:HAD-IIIA family hydrolase [Culicoidibacter larvae]